MKLSASTLLTVVAFGTLVACSAQAQSPTPRYAYSTFNALASPVVLPMENETNWLTGQGVSLADKIFPHVHLDTAFGTSSRPQEELATGHHDPARRDGATIQNIEVSLSGRLNEHHEFFITYAGAVGTDDRLDPVFEEVFWKLKNLPGGFELRGGRVYNRFGIQNTYHPHGFDWIDQYLVNTRMLGDDSLTTIGAEITWLAPLPWTSQFDFGMGVVPKHDQHAHEHGHEDEHEHGHHSVETSTFSEDQFLFTSNWTNVYLFNDFHQFRIGASGAWGDRQSGHHASVYGAHFEYQWRENGFDPGGHYFRVRSEAMVNRFQIEDDHHEEHPTGTQNHFGAYLSLLYGLPNRLEFGLRGEYVSGNSEADHDARFRVSPGITWYANDARTLRLRLQYNYDHSNERGTDHALWAQVSFTWGGPEVR